MDARYRTDLYKWSSLNVLAEESQQDLMCRIGALDLIQHQTSLLP